MVINDDVFEVELAAADVAELQTGVRPVGTWWSATGRLGRRCPGAFHHAIATDNQVEGVLDDLRC